METATLARGCLRVPDSRAPASRVSEVGGAERGGDEEGGRSAPDGWSSPGGGAPALGIPRRARIIRPRGEDLQAARLTPLLAELNDIDLAAVLGEAQTIVTTAAGRLFDVNRPVQRLAIVLQGLVHCLGPGDTVMDVAGPGAVLGLMSLFDPQGYACSSKVLGGSRLLMLSAAALRRGVAERPGVRQAVIRALGQERRTLTQALWDLKSLSPSRRLAQLILYLACQDTVENREAVRLPVSKAVMASCLGMRAESLSRALNRLEAHGVMREGEGIRVADRVALRRFCDCS